MISQATTTFCEGLSATVSHSRHRLSFNPTHNNPDEQHAQYLTPAFALSGTLPTLTPPEYKDMSPADLAALAAELEPDIRSADNDMREIDDLQRKGITGAGMLSGVLSGQVFRSAHTY
jgi:hypothetical protein